MEHWIVGSEIGKGAVSHVLSYIKKNSFIWGNKDRNQGIVVGAK